MERRVLEVGRNRCIGRRRGIELTEVEKRAALENGREILDPRVGPRGGSGRVQLRDATLVHVGGRERLRILSDVADRNAGTEQLGKQDVRKPGDRVHLADAGVRCVDLSEGFSRAIGLPAQLLNVAIVRPELCVLLDERPGIELLDLRRRGAEPDLVGEQPDSSVDANRGVHVRREVTDYTGCLLYTSDAADE